MNNQYFGNYSFDMHNIMTFASIYKGVYYCGNIGTYGQLIPWYIGRAVGDNVSIKSRLLDHLKEKKWSVVTHFGYRIFSSKEEAIIFEENEIKNYNPFYNKQLKSQNFI
jgi:excinuclease UvrABC nuclease subunit